MPRKDSLVGEVAKFVPMVGVAIGAFYALRFAAGEIGRRQSPQAQPTRSPDGTIVMPPHLAGPRAPKTRPNTIDTQIHDVDMQLLQQGGDRRYTNVNGKYLVIRPQPQE